MQELRERLARGDQAAMAELYDACADRVHHYLVVQLGSREDADDVLQETFMRIARTRERLATIDDLTAWVFTIARNEAMRLIGRWARDRQKRREMTGELLFEEGRSDQAVTRDNLQERQLRQRDRISRAMHDLELTIKDPRNGENWQVPKASRNHPGRADRRALDHQRDPYFLGGRSA